MQSRVLGGGLTRGSLTLLAGTPGIGKSTLLLQLAGLLCSHGPVVYISGEETMGQVGTKSASFVPLALSLCDELLCWGESPVAIQPVPAHTSW